MKQILSIATILFFACSINAQVNNIYATAGIAHTVGAPTFVPGARGSVVAIDTATGFCWVNPNRLSGTTWIKAGHSMREVSGCVSPSGAPAKFQSWLVSNTCATPEIYLWDGAAWDCLNCASAGAANLSWTEISATLYKLNSSTGSDVLFKEGGGLTAALSGDTLTLTAAGSSTVTTNATLTGDGSGGSPLGIAQQAATNGQVLKWNGSTWLPSADGGTTYTGGTGIDVTGTVISNTGVITEVDGSVSNEIQQIDTFTIVSNVLRASLSSDGVPFKSVSLTPYLDNTDAQNLSLTGQALSISGGSGATLPIVGISAGSGIGVSTTLGVSTISNTGIITEVDGSISNEGSLTVGAGSGTTSTIVSNTSGSTAVTISASTGLSISEAGSTITLTNSAPDQTVSITGAGINVVTGTYPTFTVTGTEVDGSVSNEIQTYGHAGTTTYTNTLSGAGGSFSITGAGIAAVSQTAGAVTVTATEVDGSTTNEGSLTVGAGTGSTSIINSNTSGSTGVTLTAAGINAISEVGNVITLTATEVDGSVSNEGVLGIGAGSGTSSTLLSTTSGANAVTINAAGILAITESTSANGGSITLTATEVDGSVSNEIQTYGHAGTTTYTNTLSGAGGSFSITGAGIAAISQTAGAVTVTATEVDGSVSNELQTIANTSGATTHTVTLSNTGGSIQLAEGANVTLTTTGTGADGIVTIAATSGGGSDLSISGASSPLTLNSSSGTDVTLTAGTGITLAGTASDATITNSAPDQTVSITGAGINVTTGTYPTFTVTGTEVDGSITNEGSLTVGAGTGTTSIINSNTSGSTGVTITAAGINAISEAGNVITLTATEVDGSVSNEIQTYGHAGTTTYTNTLSGAGGSFSITGAGIAAVSQTAGAVTVTATEVDGSITNEAWTIDADDAETEVISNQTVKFQGAGITATDYDAASNVLLVTSTEVDGSTTNEGSLTVGAGTGTTSIINSNTSGSTGVTLTAAGINAISEAGNVITLTATEVDGSVSNELQTIANTSGATTHTATLSNTGGSLQLAEGSGITLTTTGTGLDGIVTIAATAGGGTVTATGGSLTANAVVLGAGTTDTKVSTGITTDGSSILNLGVNATTIGQLKMFGNTSGDATIRPTAAAGTATVQTLPATTGTLVNRVTTSNGVSASNSDGALSFTLGAITPTTVNGHTFTAGSSTFTGTAAQTYTFPTTTATIARTDAANTFTGVQTFSTPIATGSVATMTNTVGGGVPTPPNNTTTFLRGDGTFATPAGGGDVSTDAIWDAAGDIVQATGANTAAKLSIGTASQQLRVNAGGTALEYFTPSAGSGANLTFTGASTPFTLNSDTGTDVTFAAGSNITLSRISNELTIAASGGAVSTDAIWDAKGDLAVGTGADTGAKLTVGTDGGQIYADASTATGLRWLPSVISPAQITSDQDNYNPTGWANCQVLRISGDNGIRAITSFSATFAGDRKTIINVGTYPLYIPGDHPDGTAANRVTDLFSDFFLGPGKAVDIIYDGTLSRWIILGQSCPMKDLKSVEFKYSGSSVTAGDLSGLAILAIGTGSIATGSGSANGPSFVNLGTATSASAGYNIYFAKQSQTFGQLGSSHISCSAIVSIPALSDGTNTFLAGIQILNSITSGSFSASNSIGIRYTNAVNGGRWQGYTRDNANAETTVDLGVTVSVNTPYNLSVEVDKVKGEARFYVDGVMAGVCAATMPNTAAAGCRALILKSAGTTTRNFYVHSIYGSAVYP